MKKEGTYLPLQQSGQVEALPIEPQVKPNYRSVALCFAVGLLMLGCTIGLATSMKWIAGFRAQVYRNSMQLSNLTLTNDIAYVQYGPMHEWQAIAMIYTRYAHPNAAIHVLRHPMMDGEQDDVNVEWSNIFRQNSIVVEWVSPSGEANRQLARTYQHSSLNPFAYELFCMQRWATLHAYLTAKDIDSVLVLDADIVPMDNLIERFPFKDWQPDKQGVYMQFWSRERLGSFAFYISAFYDRSTRQVCADIDAVGGDFGVEVWDDRRGSIIDCGDQSPKQISDMFLFVEFQRLYKIIHVIRYESPYPQLLVAIGQPHIIADDLCSSFTKFTASVDWVTAEEKDRRLAIKATADVMWAIHMQGDCKSIIVPLFCSKLKPSDRRLLASCR